MLEEGGVTFCQGSVLQRPRHGSDILVHAEKLVHQNGGGRAAIFIRSVRQDYVKKQLKRFGVHPPADDGAGTVQKEHSRGLDHTVLHLIIRPDLGIPEMDDLCFGSADGEL